MKMAPNLSLVAVREVISHAASVRVSIESTQTLAARIEATMAWMTHYLERVVFKEQWL